ncbi:MAG: peptidoglycan DD-metalloendopeptidase family protein [Oscillospiraceae bacterium]
MFFIKKWTKHIGISILASFFIIQFQPLTFALQGNGSSIPQTNIQIFNPANSGVTSGTQSQIVTSNLNKNAGYDSDIKDLNGKYDQLEKQQAALQSDINNAKNEKDKQIAIKRQLEEQVNITKEQISLLNQRIELLVKNMVQKEKDIRNKEDQIQDNYDKFKARLRASYMSDDTTTLGLVFGADNFGKFLTRTEVVSRLAKHDKELVDTLVHEKKQIQMVKDQISADKEEQQAVALEITKKKKELDGQISKTNAQIHDLAAMEAQFAADSKRLKKEMAEVESEIQSIYDKIQSTGEFVGGAWAWPVPGYKQITSRYGWRFNNGDFHTGLDISGASINGKNIVSLNDGKVAHVQTSFTPGRGYGKYLIVDHGGGYTTLYAHTSNIFVNVGDTVKRGQPIAAVGNTGWSTGPHLHLEIRKNGKHMDPAPHLGV